MSFITSSTSRCLLGRLFKSIADKVIAARLLLLALSWLPSGCCELDSGVPHFRQKRYGFNNDLIEVYKFVRCKKTARHTAQRMAVRDDPLSPKSAFIRKPRR